MTDNPLFLFVLFPLAAYLIGSTPVGVLIARSKGIDLRAIGSGNVGATNVARTLGRRWGYVCFFFDVAKGLAPVLAAGLLLKRQDGFPTAVHQSAWLAVGFGAIAGHVFSFYLRFHGGKGVATTLGVVLGIYPYFTWPGLCAFAVWIAVTLVSRYVSLGSIVAACAFLPLFALFNWPVQSLWPLGVFAAAMVVLLIWRHRTNLQRLLKGEENKIGRKG